LIQNINISARHEIKLRNLGLHIDNSSNPAAIVNLTNLSLNEAEVKLLSKGLEFGIFPKFLNLIDVQAEFEALFQQVAPHLDNNKEKIKFKGLLHSSYSDFTNNFFFNKRTDKYFSKHDHDILTKFSKLKNIVISKADKGNTLVLMYKSDYNDKMYNILNDNSKFKKVNEDTTRDRHGKFQGWLWRHKGLFSESEYKNLYPSSATVPTMYGLPKIHKEGTPLRPILSMVGTFNHALAQFLCKLFKFMKDSDNICRDSFNLQDILAKSDLHKSFLVSYDIDSLFTNIPVNEVINIILDKLYPPHTDRKTFTYAGFKRLDMKRALEWCILNNTFIFNGEYFVQIDGIAMGSPLAPVLADIFLNHVFDNRITREGHFNIEFDNFELSYFTRYVDDIFVGLESEEQALRFQRYLNDIHPNLKFKIETESLNKIPFLDLWIHKTDDGIQVSVYRKPTHSGVYTHYLSFVPFKHKRQVIFSLVDRAYKLCSTWLLFHREMENITRMLMRNGFTRNYILNFIRSYVDKKFINNNNRTDRDDDNSNNIDRKCIFFRLPYLGDVSVKTRNTINTFLRRNKLDNKLKFIFIDKVRKIKDSFKVKDKINVLMKSNAVYKLSCSCGASYIGHTERNLHHRMVEHSKTTGSKLSAVGEHLKDNPDHVVNFDEPEILAYSPYWYKRVILEALHIQSQQPSLNVQRETRDLYLFSIPCYYNIQQ